MAKQVIEQAGAQAKLGFAKGQEEALVALEQEVKLRQFELTIGFQTEEQRTRLVALEQKRLELVKAYGSVLPQQALDQLEQVKAVEQLRIKIADVKTVSDNLGKAFDDIAIALNTAFFEGKDAMEAFAPQPRKPSWIS